MAQGDMWQEMRKHLSEMKDAMDSALRRVPPLSGLLPSEYPAVDVYDTGDELVVQADVPGLARDDLTVSIRGNTLALSGKARVSHLAETECSVSERCTDAFTREVVLPADLDAEAQPSAVLENGVLTVRLKKTARAFGKTIDVEVV